jgi:hypothetical protein
MEKSQSQSILDRRNVIKTMWESGLTSGEIAKEVGISRSAVMGVVFRLKKKNVLPVKDAVKITPKKHRPKKETKTVKFNYTKTNTPNETCDMVFLFKTPKKGKTVINIEGADCRYMIERGVFCAQPGRSALRPWCEEHYPLIYVKSKYKGNGRMRLLFGIVRRSRG